MKNFEADMPPTPLSGPHEKGCLPFTVDADLHLGHRIAPYLSGDTADVVIARGTVPVRLEGSGSDGAAYQVRERRVLLTIPNGSRCLIEDGCRITYVADTPQARAELPLFLLGSAWGALCYQRGLIPLHASAVIVAGAVHAFTGPSGAGKSTMAAALAARGRPFFTDDVLIVDPARLAPVPLCFTGQKDLKLWDDAIDMAGATPGRRVREDPDIKKYYATPSVESREIVGRLANLFVLEDNHADGTTQIDRIDGSAAVLQLVQSVYRPAFAGAILGRRSLYEALAALSTKVAVQRFQRPFDPRHFTASVDHADQWISAHG